MYSSRTIRQKYFDFFKSNGHVIIPSASIIPEGDSSTLFISSGMQPLIPFLLGEKHPAGTRLVNSQKSFRTEDIEEVGDRRHTTFFEMLGNWSLGEYFKEKQLPWIFSFLIDELGLDKNRIYVTVFRGNEEINVPRDIRSVEIWKEIFDKYRMAAKDIDFPEKHGTQDGRIFYYGANKNWWSRSGPPERMPIGEIGGPDSEIFYDLGAAKRFHESSQYSGSPCHVNCDCGRYFEIGNSVFMEYKRALNGFEKLKQHNVDFGGGLERIAMVVQGFDSIFETDLFINVIKKIESLSGKNYRDNVRQFEVIADHLKAATMIMGDNRGITSNNIGQGYIVRRLVRRALRFCMSLDIKKKHWTQEIARIVANDYADIYPELVKNINFVTNELTKEEEKFTRTLERGLKEFKKICKSNKSNVINGSDAFSLYQSYGFPIEIIEELAKENNLAVDTVGFRKELERHQALSRTASVGMFKGGLVGTSFETTKLHTAAHLLLAGLRKVLGDHVQQKGSNITSERLRYDFSHNIKMTLEQIRAVEVFVNTAISKNLSVKPIEVTLNEARQMNAVGVFDSRYDNRVKVYIIGQGDNVVSREICGGPHVEETGVLGHFIIQKEESSSAGVRRIRAVLE